MICSNIWSHLRIYLMHPYQKFKIAILQERGGKNFNNST